jgi:hypothetical protein
MTMNSPDSLSELYHAAASSPEQQGSEQDAVATAELMREVGLKCIGFNGVSFCFSLLQPIFLFSFSLSTYISLSLWPSYPFFSSFQKNDG